MTSKEPDMSAGEESEMSNDYDDIAGRIEAERERERQDTRDIAALARLRAHKDVDEFIDMFERDNYEADDFGRLLLDLLRNEGSST